MIPAADADPVAEDGTWHAEVLGLEVAAVADGDVLRIGLNESDRQAHEELLHDTQPLDALTKVVEQVRAVRRAGSDHPLCLRDRDRWLRRAVVDDSSLAGVDGALTIGPWRATATGDDVVVACGAGVDLELPLRAAAAAAALGASRVVVAVPRVDALPALERLAGALGVTCEVVPVDRVPWLA